jgi:hypothetical protein
MAAGKVLVVKVAAPRTTTERAEKAPRKEKTAEEKAEASAAREAAQVRDFTTTGVS